MTQLCLQKRHLSKAMDVEELNLFVCVCMCNRKYSVKYDQGVKNLAGYMRQQMQIDTNVYVMMGIQYLFCWEVGGAVLVFSLCPFLMEETSLAGCGVNTIRHSCP